MEVPRGECARSTRTPVVCTTVVVVVAKHVNLAQTPKMSKEGLFMKVIGIMQEGPVISPCFDVRLLGPYCLWSIETHCEAARVLSCKRSGTEEDDKNVIATVGASVGALPSLSLFSLACLAVVVYGCRGGSEAILAVAAYWR